MVSPSEFWALFLMPLTGNMTVAHAHVALLINNECADSYALKLLSCSLLLAKSFLLLVYNCSIILGPILNFPSTTHASRTCLLHIFHVPSTVLEY